MPELVHPKDQGFMEMWGEDPNFDPERNKRVIEKTIRDTEANIRAKGREHKDAYRERANAMLRYLQNIKQGPGETNIERYFGKKHLNYLKGKEVADRVRDALTVYGQNGQIIRKLD